MFVTILVDNPFVLESVPAMRSLGSWESQEQARLAGDVGINAVFDVDGQVVGWKLIFLLEKFKPNNMEVSALFGHILEGGKTLLSMASKSKQERYNIQVSMKIV